MSCPHKHVHDPTPVKIGQKAGKAYWRSLEELAETKQFQEFVHREFPSRASEFDDPVSRRNFLKLMGASLALAGINAGCGKLPDEKIVPYVLPPEQVVPGQSLYFATTMNVFGYGRGVIVESREGRPIKVEGNPDHPSSLGASDQWAQASLLTLYDPDRSQNVLSAGQISTWATAIAAIRAALEKSGNGSGVRLLTETVTSPTLAAQIRAFLERYPKAKWHQFQPASPDSARSAATTAFGSPLRAVYRFDRAQRVLSLDSNFLQDDPGSLVYARQFINARRVRKGEVNTTYREVAAKLPASSERVENGSFAMNRLYVVEPMPTITGAMADHRLAAPANLIEAIARQVAERIGIHASVGSFREDWTNAVAKDLSEHRGESIVIAGDGQPAIVHMLAHAMNAALGNVGKTVFYIDPVEAQPVDNVTSLRELAFEMDAGHVETLLIFGGNPIYSAPGDLKFAERLNRVPLRIHQSLYYDETSFHCHWHIPESHYLETWGDLRAHDATASLVQPLIAPLYSTKSAHELLAAILGSGEQTGYDIVRAYWRNQNPPGDFEAWWTAALRLGVIVNSAATERIDAKMKLTRLEWESHGRKAGDIEIVFRPDPSVWDGRYANNGWLQEVPKPISQLTWDNAAMISPATARRLNVSHQQLVVMEYEGRRLKAGVYVLPGHADDCVTVHLGYGRSRAGRVGGIDGAILGFNAYALQTSTAPLFGGGLQITPTDMRYLLASTQVHHSMEGRDIVRVQSIDEFAHGSSHESSEHRTVHLSLLPQYNYQNGHKWGMSIDNNACIGCNACVVACQAENNIPVVGKDQVLNGREMHWIRIDTYFSGGGDDPKDTVFQPMLCQHCENAPCELVCPVEATSHSAEGLNEMTYNRCIGTRYCSNNCPYKVRRFNFLEYHDKTTPVLKLLRNPNVTVRKRGVMEKCSYCVQRLNRTRIEMKKAEADMAVASSDEEKKAQRDRMDDLMGRLQTACQQACPTEAIIFGDMNYRFAGDKPAHVTELKQQPQSYGVLTELNTQPRTTYLPRLRNPNPALA